MTEFLFIIAGIIIIIIYVIITKEKNVSVSSNGIENREVWEIDQEESMNKMEELCKTVFEDSNSEFQELIDKYMSKLAVKKDQLVYKDDYDDLVFDDWIKEIEKFIDNQLHNFTSDLNQKVHLGLTSHFGEKNGDSIYETGQDYTNSFLKHEMLAEISRLVSSHITNNDDEFEIDLIDPIGYEKSIEKIFQSLGWKARQTKSSGDQGADVIAEKDGYICVIQCKLYSQPVGNKAVQECFSATKFYHGNMGIVITNNSYTKSARTLAESTNIELLHHSEIENYVLSLPISQ